MFSVKKNLDKPNGGKETPIYFSITGKGIKRFRVAVEVSIHPDNWNFEAYTVKKHKDAVRINKIISDRENELTTLLLDYTARNQPINKTTVDRGLSWTKQTLTSEKLSVLFPAFIAEQCKGKAKGTKRGYETLFGVLQDYEKHTKKPFHPNNYDMREHTAFADYCYDERDYVDSTYDATLQKLKTFLGWAQRNGFAEKTERTDLNQFKRLRVRNEISPLNAEELQILENANGVFTGVLEHARNMFLFQCYTALRFNDMLSTSPAHIKGNALHFLTNKTKAGVKIPVMHQTQRIINLYRKDKTGVTPIFRQIHNSDFTKYLRRIFKELGLNRPVEVVTMKRGQATREIQPLHNVVSSHDGRRTFITLSLIAGMNAWELMSITGHENFETFKRYVKFAEQETARRLCNTWQSIIPQFTVIKPNVTVPNLAEKMGFMLPVLAAMPAQVSAA